MNEIEKNLSAHARIHTHTTKRRKNIIFIYKYFHLEWCNFNPSAIVYSTRAHSSCSLIMSAYMHSYHHSMLSIVAIVEWIYTSCCWLFFFQICCFNACRSAFILCNSTWQMSWVVLQLTVHFNQNTRNSWATPRLISRIVILSLALIDKQSIFVLQINQQFCLDKNLKTCPKG